MAQETFQSGLIDYNAGIAVGYPAARTLSAETAATWTAILAQFVPTSYLATVLDLGCGTGRFSALFAERFAAFVIGLDPSVDMLQAARHGAARDNLLYAAARAESLPLADSSCDLAWLSQVIHHIADREACARELRRVVRPGGHVLIRGAFGDRLDGYPAFLRFFPETYAIMKRFPTLDQVSAVFRGAGFAAEGVRTVPQKTCANLAEFAARTSLRADSTLALLPDAEFEKCQAALECAAREEPPTPVIETIDLLIFRAPVTGEIGSP